jgi:hypothetical protein
MNDDDIAVVVGKLIRKAIFPLEKQVPREFRAETAISAGELVSFARDLWKIDLTLECKGMDECPSPAYLPQMKLIVMNERFSQERTILACLQTAHVASHAVQDQKTNAHASLKRHSTRITSWTDKVLTAYYVLLLLVMVSFFGMTFSYDRLPPWAQKLWLWLLGAFLVMALPILILTFLERTGEVLSLPFVLSAEAQAEKLSLYLLRNAGVLDDHDAGMMKKMKRFHSLYANWRENFEPCVIYYEK